MAAYNLNEVLKEKEKNENKTVETEIKLDDVSRVKVLSPGRKVFKRFIRNRLAVFGSVLLIIMFLFSFAGPLFYAYGQKQIFYKYDAQNVNYALAKVNSAYNGYVVDDSIAAPTVIRNSMNSSVKKLLADGREETMLLEDGEAWIISRVDDNIFTLSMADAKKVCSAGVSKVNVGSYDAISGEIDFNGEEIEGLAAQAKTNVKGKDGSFTFGGVEYFYEKAQAKTYTLTAVQEGIVYEGSALSAAFERELNARLETMEPFEVGGVKYYLIADGQSCGVYSVGALTQAMIYTRLSMDTYETGLNLSDTFKSTALQAVQTDGTFTYDGADYTIEPVEDGSYMLYTADGAEFAEYSGFTVRRYSGEDSMEFRLKKEIQAAIEEMLAAGEKKTTITSMLPGQTEEGSYDYDEDGNLRYNETVLTLTQSLEGEYVINADQVIYVIDRFAAPSAKHILGTDGDGFDVLARIMYGGRVSLLVGFVVVFLETFLGIIMGGLAGYYGGWVDNLIMRLVDIFYCLPSLPIMIILGAMMDAQRLDTYIRLMVMMAALGIMGWAGVARLVRGQILSLREQEFMVAAEATGIKVRARIFRHLVPNVMPQLIVTATMGMGGVILTESTLSFLGLGVKHPLATWGTIINSVSSASAMAHYAFIWIPVGLLICLTVIAFNFVGDGLRDAYDPRSKR